MSTVATFIRFRTFVPASGKKARLLYIVPHTLNDTTNTIPDNDTEAVITLTAGLCFWALAAKFAQTTNPSIDADVIDYQRKSDTYAALAKEKFSQYANFMGMGSDSGKGAGGAAQAGTIMKEFDIVYPWGEDYLTHPSNQR